MTLDRIDVKVKKAYKKSELLDNHDEGLDFSVFEKGEEYFYYVLVFFTGYMLAKIKISRKILNTKDTQLADKIHHAKSLEALSIILVLNNQKKFNDILTSIDTKECTSLHLAKKKAIQSITRT